MNRFTKLVADRKRLDGWLDKEQADKLRAQLEEAVRLLGSASVPSPNPHFYAETLANEDWIARRDAFLNPKPTG